MVIINVGNTFFFNKNLIEIKPIGGFVMFFVCGFDFWELSLYSLLVGVLDGLWNFVCKYPTVSDAVFFVYLFHTESESETRLVYVCI